MPEYNYVVSAIKATNVTHAVTGNFTASNMYNLIISKCSRVEVHTPDDDGVRMHMPIVLYSIIEVGVVGLASSNVQYANFRSC